ncbi:MAG: ferritin-like domain-containing protein [Clostridia bacterium]|nr:ferritin-like domain-containing protein [Clostridia bacterium]
MNYIKANSIKYEDFQVNEDFPEIEASILSQEVINRVLAGYTAKKSEFTSQNQYRYQYIILTYNNELYNVGNNMRTIYLHESKHFEILGKKLFLTNVDPKLCRYIDNNPNICDYWIASNVDYYKEIAEIMKANIELENGAIRDYNEIYEMTTDENLKELIVRILKDEHSHRDYFRAVLEALGE